MELYSAAFILLVLTALVLYYTVFRNRQWICLLAAGILFYCMSGLSHGIYILITAFSIWIGSRILEQMEQKYQKIRKERELSREEKKAMKAAHMRRKRMVLFAVLLINFGILAWLKYWKAIFPGTAHGLLLPLGISFYTFLSAGYLIDVYNGKYPAEHNFLHFLLFVSYFPQLLQGPINRYDQMNGQLTGRHTWNPENAKRAFLLILFGLMKKFAIADMLSGSISDIFDGSVERLPGSLIVFGILLYSIQQYADFSGGIDIVMGVSQLFGIQMMPNFRQPYFSVSLGDFWRRWHISLGAWMRDYVFYPFALTKPMQKFGKWCSRKMGKHFGRVLPAGIANIVVFLLVGVWHGAQMHYVVWGLYNGIVIALSDILQPAFAALSGKLHLPVGSKGFYVFRVIRTFIIVNIGWYFDRIYDFGKCLTCLAHTVISFNAGEFAAAMRQEVLNPDLVQPVYIMGGYALAFAALMIVIADSILKEQKKDVYAILQRRTVIFKWALCYAMIFLMLGSFIFTRSAGGFMYANF